MTEPHPSSGPIPAGGTGRVTVCRPPGGDRDRLRRYGIEIDGVSYGAVRAGEQLDVEVLAGQHHVRASLDWCSSPAVPVDVPAGGQVMLRVEPGGNAFQLWHIFQRGRYLKLSQDR